MTKHETKPVVTRRPLIEIVSGEGEQGTVEQYYPDYGGCVTVRGIRARLDRERCGGDRWAYACVDGVRIIDNDLDYVLRGAPIDRKF